MVEAAKNLGKTVHKITHSQLWKDVVQTSQKIEEFPRKIMEETELEENLQEIDHTLKKDLYDSSSRLTRPPLFDHPQEEKIKNSNRPKS